MTNPEFKIDYKTGDVEPLQLTYFQQRMASMGISSGNITFEVPDWRTDGEELVTHRRFSEDQDGNIVIHYYDLLGRPAEYKHDTKWGKPYTRTRLRIEQKTDTGTKKYHAPTGSGTYIYFTPELLAKYYKKETIRTLIVTEGEFKATVGCMHGLDVVGISGIQSWHTAKGEKRLHHDLTDLIIRCGVVRLLFLTDADTLTLTYKSGKELTERPYHFYGAVKGFREAALTLIESNPECQLTDVYFAHIATDYATSAKGLDDLLINLAIQNDKIIQSLKEIAFNTPYFSGMNISDGVNKLKEYFGLTTAEKFCQVYQRFIDDKEFVYHKLTYRWDSESQTLHRIKHGEIKDYMRIGCDWFKLVRVPNAHGEHEEEIKKWKVSEISRDYGKKYPHFLEDTPKYDAWCNVPSMNGTYQRIIGNCFNLFNPIIHPHAEGDFPHTKKFIRHLFRGEGDFDRNITGDPFTVALDYLTLQYQYPTQILPVLCLVSPENGTGKSTFLKWLRDIYGSNATIIDNERFKQSFNSHYITKYIIGIDEGFLDVDKRAEKERLKKLATDERQYLEFKGADVQEIAFYGKIIICSNDADSLMKIEEGEIRWFVIRVHPFDRNEEIPDLRASLKTEIPAWLHYLSQRKVHHEKQGRAWFHPDHLVTDQLRIIIDKTRNRLDKVVEEVMQDMFSTYKVNRILIDVKRLVEIINREGYSKYKIDVQDVKNYLKDKRKMMPGAPQRVMYPLGFIEGVSGQDEINWNKSYTARCYEFLVQDWLPDHDQLGIQRGIAEAAPAAEAELSTPTLTPNEQNEPF